MHKYHHSYKWSKVKGSAGYYIKPRIITLTALSPRSEDSYAHLYIQHQHPHKTSQTVRHNITNICKMRFMLSMIGGGIRWVDKFVASDWSRWNQMRLGNIYCIRLIQLRRPRVDYPLCWFMVEILIWLTMSSMGLWYISRECVKYR